MFDDILQMVREHLGNNPAVAAAIPAEQADAVHSEVASHITNALQNPAAGGSGGILSELENSLRSGNLATTAITGGLASSLASKFGLPPLITGAIAAAVPGLLQKYLNKNEGNNPPATS